jgi:hypothetical protein
MSNGEIKIPLTRGQVKHVLREAAQEQGVAGVLGGLKDRSHLAEAYHGLSESHQLSRSLLLGLIVLVCFPRDGGALGVKEVAQEIGLSPSTAHRYITTLVTAGLLEQEPKTRRYRLTTVQ